MIKKKSKGICNYFFYVFFYEYGLIQDSKTIKAERAESDNS